MTEFLVVGCYDHDDGGRFAETFETRDAADAEDAARDWCADNIQDERNTILDISERESVRDEVVIAGVLVGADIKVIA